MEYSLSGRNSRRIIPRHLFCLVLPAFFCCIAVLSTSVGLHLHSPGLEIVFESLRLLNNRIPFFVFLIVALGSHRLLSTPSTPISYSLVPKSLQAIKSSSLAGVDINFQPPSVC